MQGMCLHRRALVAAVLLLAGGTGPARAADLKVGANIGNVPWEFQDASGKIVGFEIDLVNEVGKRLGKTVEIVNIPFHGPVRRRAVRPDRRRGLLDHDHQEAARNRSPSRSPTTTATSR